MNPAPGIRYTDAAIILHWMIAALILGLLAAGKFMVSLDDNDPLRFALTQWHKSFGFCVLVLSVLRLVWRTVSPPPPSDIVMPAWQVRAASATHGLLYALSFALPVTGWIMVSASPLNIDTILFNAIALPHLPPFESLANRAQVAERFAHLHELASHALIVLLVMHVGAALKHHLLHRDGVLLRMLPDTRSRSFRRAGSIALAAILALVAALLWQSQRLSSEVRLVASSSEVQFVASISGDEAGGAFAASEVDAQFDPATAELIALSARVQTGGVISDNPMLQDQLPDAEWFDAAQFPTAQFQSTAITEGADGTLRVRGELTIKGRVQAVDFPLSIETLDGQRTARGRFAIDRRDFDVGMASQPTDETVGYEVWVLFAFGINDAAALPRAGRQPLHKTLASRSNGSGDRS